MTGSYPALDIAILAAIKTLGLKPLIILSAASSNYGANRTNMTWPLIYRTLVDQSCFEYEPLAATIGGRQDRGYGMTAYGKEILANAIKYNKFKYLEIPKTDSTNTSVKERIDLYNKAANGDAIRAYVNVGGNMPSIGLKLNTEKPKIKPKSVPSGITRALPDNLREVNSVAVYFLKQDTPVINVRNITNSIIRKYEFPERPRMMPIVGHSKVFVQPMYREWLAILVLIIDLTVLAIVAILSRKYLVSHKKGAMNTDD